MQGEGILNPADNLISNMTAHPLTDTLHTTHLDDERISHTTTKISPHLEGTPHAYIITTPKFSHATYGMTLMANRQLRWTATIPTECIDDKLPEDLRKTMLAQVQTITRKNVDKTIAAKNTCTIHSQEFQDLSATTAFNLSRAETIQTLHKHLTEVSHRHQNKIANTLDNLSQATQALLEALDLVQPSTPWNTDERQNTMVFTPTEVDYNSLRLPNPTSPT